MVLPCVISSRVITKTESFTYTVFYYNLQMLPMFLRHLCSFRSLTSNTYGLYVLSTLICNEAVSNGIFKYCFSLFHSHLKERACEYYAGTKLLQLCFIQHVSNGQISGNSHPQSKEFKMFLIILVH